MLGWEGLGKRLRFMLDWRCISNLITTEIPSWLLWNEDSRLSNTESVFEHSIPGQCELQIHDGKLLPLSSSPALALSTETVLSLWHGLGHGADWEAVGWSLTLLAIGGWHQTLVTLSRGVLTHEYLCTHLGAPQCRTCSHRCVYTCVGYNSLGQASLTTSLTSRVDAWMFVRCPWLSAHWSWTWWSEMVACLVSCWAVVVLFFQVAFQSSPPAVDLVLPVILSASLSTVRLLWFVPHNFFFTCTICFLRVSSWSCLACTIFIFWASICCCFSCSSPAQPPASYLIHIPRYDGRYLILEARWRAPPVKPAGV